MARFFVAHFNPSNSRWEGVDSGDGDHAFDAASGTAANTAAALLSGNIGKYAAFPVDGAATATLTTSGPANSNILYTAQGGGPIGNNITIRYVVSGNNTPLTVSVSGRDITVNVATSAGGAATSTGNQVLAAVNGNAVASTLVVATLAAGNDGTGVVAAFTVLSLTGATTGAATVEVLTFNNATVNTPDAW